MKIEMGESLFYSWLRHVKECQIVQNNWKISAMWDLKYEDQLTYLMQKIDAHYSQKYNYRVFKNNSSLKQLLGQAECDVLGISIKPDETKLYAVDVAFHESGLNYGSRDITAMKVTEKCARTAFCLYGYLDNRDAEIIFASPKINPAILEDLTPCINDLNEIFNSVGVNYTFRLIANEEYNDKVLKPILIASDDVADTSELFMRSYQMFKMFKDTKPEKISTARIRTKREPVNDTEDEINTSTLNELKIGKIAQKILMPMLESGLATVDEISWMQDADYSKQSFDLQFPLLVPVNSNFDSVRYYSRVLNIYGRQYRMCSQWFEVAANNDRPYLLRWIANHQKNEMSD